MAETPQKEDVIMFSEIMSKTSSTLSTLSWPVELTGEVVTFVLLMIFLGLSNLENRFPKIKRPVSETKQSYRINLGLFVFNNLLLSACSVTTLFLIAEHYAHMGPLSRMHNQPVKLLLAFLAFDFLLYVWHWISHNVNTFWVFHRVHHNDPLVNVSTAFRLHFVEALITHILKALLIVLLGIDKTVVLLIEAFSTMFIMFHHTNIGFRSERLWGLVVIVPSLHRTHHSVDRSEHDSNYGAVLSIWDRLFGTLLEAEPKKIGIHGDSPQDLFGLVKFGLGLGKPKTAMPHPANLDSMIAEAAYYKAEKRNFRPGDEMRDWLEAKTEVLSQLYGKKRIHRHSPSNWWDGFFSHS